MSPGSRSWLWVWCCVQSLSVLTRCLELRALFEFGEEAGDRQLPPGSDASAELRLKGSVWLFGQTLDSVYINTNGFVAAAEPPAEEDYLGKSPATFKMVAALLGDLDTSDGQGKVHFREDRDPGVLSRAAGIIARAFPSDAIEDPSSALVVTWENVAARGTSGRGDGPDSERNTFQLVVASSASSSHAILLYPRGGLQFVSTAAGGTRKLVEAGFSEGVVPHWLWDDLQGKHFPTTTNEEASIRALTEKTNSGLRGVWVYDIHAPDIIPGSVSVQEDPTTPATDPATKPTVTMLPRQPDEPQEVEISTYQTQWTLTTEAVPEENEEFSTEMPIEFQPSYPEAEVITPVYSEPDTEDYEESDLLERGYLRPEIASPTYTSRQSFEPTYPNRPEPRNYDHTETREPVSESLQPTLSIAETSEPPDSHLEPTNPHQPGTSKPPDSHVEPTYPDQGKTRDPDSESLQPTLSIPETRDPTNPPVEKTNPDRPETREPIPDTLQPTYTVPQPSGSPSDPMYAESEEVQPQYIRPESAQPVPPRLQPQHPQIVIVEQEEHLDINVFSYNPETCAHNRHQCSAFAECRDHSTGFCCHCRPGFYGDGKDCVAEGKPQRMNGKVNGHVFVGDSSSPVELDNKDLHSYVVANDGRAYVAISSIPASLGPSLLPLSSLGGVMGWAFALEQPGHQNGFRLTGGVFARQAEVVFQPGNERLSIKQQFKGIDEHDHLVVSTELEGRLPAVPPGSTVRIDPYKEIYQYDRDLVTSSSSRDYTVTSPDGHVQVRSYQWRQTITFRSCPHADATGAPPTTQQLSVDQIFVMFDPDNLLVRFAMSNRIGSVHGGPPEQNPCFTGRHSCDINAACRPGRDLQFSCECAAGFSGDGRYCHDTDECSESPLVCGANGVCSNQPGSFRCECAAGFLFASDGRTCVEENRPVNHCQRGSHDCDAAAQCSYSGGSAYFCSCLPGFAGDGRACRDVDECRQDPCHRDAHCTNSQGSYSCQCHPGFHGDGFRCSPATTERQKTPCERHRDAVRAAAPLHPRPAVVGPYVPQCDEHGGYAPTQCHATIHQCWCVDAGGQEVPNTRTGAVDPPPLCIDQAVTPAPVGPTPRPDVRPVAPGTHLLFAQSGRIEHVPLDGYMLRTEEARTLLHIPDRVVIAVAYDCLEKTVYWSDITGPAISRAALGGGAVVPVVSTELLSPEGIAIDHVARLLFWTDSMRDTVEVSRLDGSRRRVLFDSDLVNPRPIVTNPAYGRLYWADWNRDGPKIEMANMDGTERTVLVKDDLGLPNGLTFDPDNQLLCWADAGTRRLECMDPHRRVRRQIADGVQYPFALVSYGRNLYYTDWRREALVAVDRRSERETQELVPQKRSRIYGLTTTPAQCPRVYNYCSNNGGCSHLCLPRLGGFTCRCPDASHGRCDEGSP